MLLVPLISAVALATPFAAERVVVADGISCALSREGQAYCWGKVGEQETSRPVEVPELPEPGKADHSCEVAEDGSVFCKGENDHGQLGDGAPLVDPVPRPVPRMIDATHLVVAANEACAIQGRKLFCWGSEMSMPGIVAEQPHVLGDGQYAAGCHATGGQLTCHVSDLKGGFRRHAMGSLDDRIVAIAADRGTNLCVATEDAEVHCRLALEEGGMAPGFTRLAGLNDVIELVAGARRICGRTRAGAVGCWTSPGTRLEPVDGLNRTVQLAAADGLICARTLDAEVLCVGKLGDEFTADKATAIATFAGASDIDGNHRHVCAVVEGEVRCIGKAPAKVPLPQPAVEVGVGRDHTCALLEDGTVWCWGSDRRGQLGRARLLRTDEPTPVFETGELFIEPPRTEPPSDH